MWINFRRSLATTVNLFLPPVCLLCGQQLTTTAGTKHLCDNCLSAIPALTVGHCSRCAQPFQGSTSNHLCGPCLNRPPKFSRVHSAGRFEGPLKDAVHRLKYRNQLILAEALGELLANTVLSHDNSFTPELIVPVPLHIKRLRQRGFNQALEIARPIGRVTKALINTTLLQRTRETPHQQGLSAIERRSNLRNAFALTSAPTAKKVLLVDDVMTTGETVRECCRTLQAGGVEELQVAVVTRA